MVRARAGKGSLGCIVSLLFMATISYFAINASESYWDYIQFQDRMKQEARFAQHRSNATIARRLSAYADSLGLPEGARKVNVRRNGRTIHIWAEYYQHIELPGMVREFFFHPEAVRTF